MTHKKKKYNSTTIAPVVVVVAVGGSSSSWIRALKMVSWGSMLINISRSPRDYRFSVYFFVEFHKCSFEFLLLLKEAGRLVGN